MFLPSLFQTNCKNSTLHSVSIDSAFDKWLFELNQINNTHKSKQLD